MTNVSAFGVSVRVVASNTFPTGITIDQFDDGTDPFDFDSMDIGAFAMDLNGNPITWVPANGIPFSITVLSGTDSAVDMNTLFEANRAGNNKRSAFDKITITVTYPTGQKKVLSEGTLLTGTPGTGVNTTGRKKPRTYGFIFASQSGD